MAAIKVYKDVVIIGNGPSAITLSYILSGNWPYYTGLPHSNEFLQYRLQENPLKSLVEQDLEFLSDGLEGRSKNPVSLLFDMLNHPDADLGIENPSLLKWEFNPENTISHAVLGRGLPGGCWQDMEGNILTISLGSWMELPDLSFQEWDTFATKDSRSSGVQHNRATVSSVAQYYQDYVEIKGLNQNFVNHTLVHSVKKVQNPDDNSHLWLVKGQQAISNKETGETTVQDLSYLTRHVVLATGNSDQPNRLNVPGEDLPFVIHTLNDLEKLIMRKKLNSNRGNLLIIGAGLSAADAVIAARFHGVPTVHVFRRNVEDPELIFNKLPANMYPEYHKVHQMMRDFNGVSYNGYQSHQAHTVSRINSNRTVCLTPLNDTGPQVALKVTYVLVLIGKKPDLSFMPEDGKTLLRNWSQTVDNRNSNIPIDKYTHESAREGNVFAMGPLVGDNFVRFIQGGGLAIANHLHKKQKYIETAANNADVLI